MPRTSTQPRPPEGLLSLDDDTLRNVLLFLSIAEGRSGPGETSKALRQAVASTQLARARATAPYVLRVVHKSPSPYVPRGDTHGVVHALATSMGTRQWPTRRCVHGYDNKEFEASSPPDRLEIWIERRIGPLGDTWVRQVPSQSGEDRCFRSNIVDPSVDRRTIKECNCSPGSFVEYQLPFQLRISHFRFGHGHCGACNFRHWVFEAYDIDRLEWHTLYDSNGVSPWADIDDSPYPRPWEPKPETKYFDVDAFTSDRFRIRLTDWACMHLRAFEVFGTVLPPWQV